MNTTTMRRGFIPLTIILITMLATASGAYVLKSWRWPSPKSTFDDSALSSSWRGVVRNAAEEWEDTNEFDWSFSSSSQNKIKLSRIDGSNGTLATTTSERIGNFLYKIGIVFDSSESWHTSSGTPPSSKYDALSVATHEFGHAVGIDHPQNERCSSKVSKSDRPTMCQHGTPSDAKRNDTYRRSLEDDDEDAIEDQYDGKAAGDGLYVPSTGRTVCVDFDVARITQDDRARSAAWVVHGTVTSVGTTRWNSNDGAYWDDSESSVARLPYHIVTIAPSDIVVDEGNKLAASTSIDIAVMQMSPLDSLGCGDSSVGPYRVGDDVIVFLERGKLGWRTGGFRSFIQPVNDAVSATLFRQVDGLFVDQLAEDVHESAVSLSELVERVEGFRSVQE